MLSFKNRGDRGFTLMELMIVITIVSIIAAIAAPNLLGFLNRNQVNEALEKLVGAIKETQRQAMRQGKLCRVNINTNTQVITGNPTGCLLSDRTIKDSIDIRTNLTGSPPNIAFSHKGSTTKMGTIVLSSDDTDLQKCFVIALGTGITRTGDYTGSKTGSVSASNCRTNK